MSKYEGDERIRGMQVLNLIRDFELQKMKETESIKEYSDRLLNIAKRVRLLGPSLLDSRIVEKNLLTMLERFEASITALENTKDLSMITPAELLNALQAQEQRRVMRQDGAIEGALPVKHHMNARNNKTKKGKKHQGSNGEYTTNNNKSIVGNKNEPHPLCQHCGGKSHLHFKCWRRPNAMCTKCKLSSTKTKISNMVKRHKLLIKRKINCSWLHVSLAWNQVRIVSLTVVALTT